LARNLNNAYIPLGKMFACLAKKTLGALSEKLDHTGLDRFFYPLLKVSEAGGTLTQQKLADVLDTDKVTTVRIIDHLSKKGLVKRQVNKLDRREHLLTLTAKGQKIIPQIERGFSEFEEAAFSGISKSDKLAFIRIMDRIKGNISLLPSRKLQMKVNYNHKNKKAVQ
jgi:MarR family transcriptional regulator for hemolysin